MRGLGARVRGLHLQPGASSRGLVHPVCVLGAASGGAALWVWSRSGGDVGMCSVSTASERFLIAPQTEMSSEIYLTLSWRASSYSPRA